MADAIEDFDKAVVFAGWDSSTKPSDVDIPMIGYYGTRDSNKGHENYMKRFDDEVAEGSVIGVNATHGTVIKESYELDENNNGISDLFEWLFSEDAIVVEDALKNTESNENDNNTSIEGDRSDTSAYWSTYKVEQKLKEHMSQKQNVGDTTNLQPKNNSDIAHRGYTPGGIYDNSAEGFKLAGDKGFWGCEADIRFDENGNLVCSHNAVKDGEKPPSLEEFLDICAEYGMTAIIDLKYENGPDVADVNLSPAILKTIQEKGMMDSCVLQTDNTKDITYIRENSEDARIWYLTDEIYDSKIDLIKENDVECVNIKSSSDKNAYRIKKLTENGIDVCVWNVQSEASKQGLLNTGATYVMSDYVLGITPYQEGEEDFNGLKNNSNETNGKDSSTNMSESNEDNTNTENNNGDTSTTTKEDTSNGDAKPKWEEGYLTAPKGVIEYKGDDGKNMSETWCPLGVSTLLENMEKYEGISKDQYWIREDGVKNVRRLYYGSGRCKR